MSRSALDWERMLGARGYRVTPQRARVLEAIAAADEHSTTLGEIHARVRRYEGIDRSTVYRALRLFVQLGIVVETGGIDGETRFEVLPEHPHHHLVCRVCGHEQEIDSDDVAAVFERISSRFGFHVTTEHLTLFGVCAQCQTRLDEGESGTHT